MTINYGVTIFCYIHHLDEAVYSIEKLVATLLASSDSVILKCKISLYLYVTVKVHLSISEH